MTLERIHLYDTTLRDGAQTSGVDFSVEDKRAIALALDALGIDYVEGGWPGANPTDTAFFTESPGLKRAKFTAFGMTKRVGRSVSNDPGLASILNAVGEAACLVGKASAFQVEVALGVSRGDNVSAIRESIGAVVKRGKEALFDAEHFFDGYKQDPVYAFQCIKAAYDSGARWIVLCDTNGGSMPEEVERIVTEVAKRIPGDRLGIHAHNDTDQAVAVSLAALRGGARQIQGTLNGLGERCGNANLVSIIPTLLLKADYVDRFEVGITLEGLKGLSRTSHLLDEILNRSPNRHAPYVGESAFAHKGGLHVSAVQKDPRTYEHVPPESVGNRRRILVSDQAGRSNVALRLAEAGIKFDAHDPKLQRLLDEVKEREFLGYAYDGAEASFELLARRVLGEVPEFFKVESFRVSVEQRNDAPGPRKTVSEATVKLSVGSRTVINATEGHGPVDALNSALRKDLGVLAPYLADLELVDFKVRILTTGTGAVTRVLVESKDGTGTRWFTVGVSENIIEASFEALMDSIVYKLLREKAQVPK